MKKSNHFSFPHNPQGYMQPPQRFGNVGQKFTGYNLSGRTSPYRSRMPGNPNPKMMSSSTRTSPTMIMRNMPPDMNTKFTKKRVNSGVIQKSSIVKRPSGSFHSALRNNMVGLPGSKATNKIDSKRRIQRTQVKVPSKRKVEYSRDRKFVMEKIKVDGQRKSEVTPIRKTAENVHQKYAYVRNGKNSISSKKEIKGGNLEKLLNAHDKILSSALNEIGKGGERGEDNPIRVSGNVVERPSKSPGIRLDILNKYRNQKNNLGSFQADRGNGGQGRPGEVQGGTVTGDIKIDFDKRGSNSSIGAKKSLINSIRKNVVSRNDMQPEGQSGQNGNYNTQVYSNLQIVNSNIYFPVVQGGRASSHATPIRVERKVKTEDMVRIEGNYDKKEKEEAKVAKEEVPEVKEGQEKMKEGVPEAADLSVETMPVGGNLAMRYEDTLSILQSKVDKIKADVLGEEFSPGAIKSKIEKKQEGSVRESFKEKRQEKPVKRPKYDTVFSEKPSKRKEFGKKRRRKKLKNPKQGNKGSKSLEKSSFKNKLSKGNPRGGNRSKKSKFLEFSESRELNRFDRTLLENNDAEDDSMLLGRRKRDQRGEKQYKSLQKKNPKIRFKDFSTKKEYTKRYNNKKKVDITKAKEKNKEFMALLENQSEEEEDIENVKFEVSSICSDIVGFGGELDDKKKGYSELTRIKQKIKNKQKKDGINQSYFASESVLGRKRKSGVNSNRTFSKRVNKTSKKKTVKKRTQSKRELDVTSSKITDLPQKISKTYSSIEQSKKLFQNSLRGAQGEENGNKKFLKQASKRIETMLQKLKKKGFSPNSEKKSSIKSKMSTSFEQTRDQAWFGNSKPSEVDKSFASATYEADLSQFNPKSKKSQVSKKSSILEPVLDEEKRENFKKQMGQSKSKKRRRRRKDFSQFTPSSLNSAKLSLKSSQITNSTKKFNSQDFGSSSVIRQSISRRNKNLKLKGKKKLPKFERVYYIDKLIESFKTKESEELRPKNPKSKKITFYEHFVQSTQSIIYIQNTEKPSEDVLLDKKVYLPPQQNGQKKTLIFDLDETLIHCNDNPETPCDIKVPIKFTGGDIVEAGLVIRPYAVECLKELSKYYEIVIFTASHSCYANIVLNLLDPENKYITYRLFREHCIKTKEGIFIKDLRVFANRKMKDLIIVDNAFYSFGFQLYNGVPILPFYDDKMDNELEDLAEFMKAVKGVPDIREAFKKIFMGEIYRKYANRPEILSQMIINQRKKI